MSDLARHTTPPPASRLPDGQLLTPPSTSQSTKRVRFEVAQDSRKRIQYGGGEASSTAFVEIDYSDECKGSSADSDGNSDEAPNPQTTALSTAAPITSHYKKTELEVLHDLDNIGYASMFDRPLTFMKLPTTVRKLIYEYLLVIPAIICVRQNYSPYQDEKRAFLYQEVRNFLPGIAYALAQMIVNGYKFRFTRFQSASTVILHTCKEVYHEAKPILYGQNVFEIIMPSPEMSPPVNYNISLFGCGCQRQIRQLVIRMHAFYPAQWLLNGGHAKLKTAYRGLESLLLVLELETADKGLGKRYMKRHNETWVPYVKRLHDAMAAAIAGAVPGKPNPVKAIMVPLWIDLRILFDGDHYDEMSAPVDQARVSIARTYTEVRDEEEAAQSIVKRGMGEAFELFKKGGVSPPRAFHTHRPKIGR